MSNRGAANGGHNSCSCEEPSVQPRRQVLKGALALAMAPLGSAFAQGDARTMRPQPGDRLVYLAGDKKGQPVMLADLEVGQQPRLALPADAATGGARDGARLNQVLIARVDEPALSAATKPRSAAGVVAYSAICTHNGCPVTLLHADQKSVVCNCHGSRFDIADNGTVVEGPATRRLASLPIAVTDGYVTVAGAFMGALGAAPASQ